MQRFQFRSSAPYLACQKLENSSGINVLRNPAQMRIYLKGLQLMHVEYFSHLVLLQPIRYSLLSRDNPAADLRIRYDFELRFKLSQFCYLECPSSCPRWRFCFSNTGSSVLWIMWQYAVWHSNAKMLGDLPASVRSIVVYSALLVSLLAIHRYCNWCLVCKYFCISSAWEIRKYFGACFMLVTYHIDSYTIMVVSYFVFYPRLT